ncbi:MAG: hypothetical protein H6606_01380 [Flavobacteriales bacterium]|nr:hypothetical protein [Flavobacteriales bacterium]
MPQSEGQDSINYPDLGLFPKKPDPVLYTFKVGGTYRFFGTYTVQKDPFLISEAGNDTVLQKNVFIGDDSQLPNLTLNFSGRPSERTSWGFDLYAFQFLDGQIGQTYGNGQVKPANRPSIYSPLSGTRMATNLGLLLGINLYGNFQTDFASISVKTGGIHWVSISDLTLRAFTGYNRFTLFERNPWDPVVKDVESRYSTFQQAGVINQDMRWGERAFTGTIVEMSQLPGDLTLKALYGKTELNGGFLTIPNLSFGGQLKKTVRSGFVAMNTFNNQTYTDSLNTAGIGFNIATIEVSQPLAKGIELHSEIGMGRYFSPEFENNWGEALNLKLHFTDEISKIPVELHYFRVSPRVLNNNALFWNTAIVETRNNTIPAGVVGSSALLFPFASSLTAIGQFTNNRHGLNINAEIGKKNAKLSIANGISEELEALSDQISFGHPVNQLTRSRFWRWNFPTGVGPYNRYNVIFRDIYEIARISGGPVAKRFNVMEIQGKYKSLIDLKNFYAFLLCRYSSVQDFLSPITVFSERAYLRHYSSELETYYALHKNLVLATYTGYERILANYDTDIDDLSNRPRNQEGWGFGLGLDYDFAKNTALYLRHRWFSFEDRNFIKDRASGTETIVEIKLAF